MRETATDLSTTGIRLPDAVTGAVVDLGDRRGVEVLTLIRHRF
ncbi:hypothetical protein EV383_0676 [Pseudonocardia sediminis]|uniref:Uncharacterized protein n=1 Tax=Pseudonocardia sediminis TaxID=1397368 RepID=A0A4Q7UQ17_PSEST|nr:hypothetical protein [Pseudonocardia sediminis]RZT83857.1 hypothetical protein EV383_0676 [Pseudonocardia sediminis]